MKEDKIRNAFKNLNPDSDQKEKVWQKIELVGERKKMLRRSIWKTVAAAVLVIVVTGVAVNQFTDGAVIAAIRHVCGWDKKSEDIIGRVKDVRVATKAVFAPEICELTKERLIFGTDSGLLIYNRDQKQLQATIDLQEIGCIYFDGEQKRTHIYAEKENLYVFNTENDKIFGAVYCYDLKQDTMNLKVSNKITDSKDISECWKKWKKQNHEYLRETYEDFFKDSEDLEKELKEENQLFSENSYLWLDKKEEKLSCLLVSHEGKYTLLTKDIAAGSISKEELSIVNENQESTTSTFTGDLPKFVYDGKNAILRAIMNESYQEIVRWDGADVGEILIPTPMIVEIKTEGNEKIVFGSFWYFGFYKNGDILESMSGGESNAACIHLKKQGNEYKVTKIERTGDGGMKREDMIRITKKYPGLCEKMLDASIDDERLEKIMKKWIRYYVRKNHLNVKYYKEIGWDPVKIQ